MIDKNIECGIGNGPQVGRVLHLTEITPKHHPEMTLIVESKPHVCLQKRTGGVLSGTPSSGAQSLTEHRESLEGDSPEHSPTVLEVVVRGLVAHPGIGREFAKGQRVGPVLGDVINGGTQNCFPQRRRSHTAMLPTNVTLSRQNLTLSCRLATVRP